MICLRQQLWGKSKAYLLESLAANRTAATLLALARLADAIGDEREAARVLQGSCGCVRRRDQVDVGYSGGRLAQPLSADRFAVRLTRARRAPYLRAQR